MAGGGYAGAGWRPTPTRCLRTLVSRLQSPTFITAFARRTKVSSYPPPKFMAEGQAFPCSPAVGKAVDCMEPVWTIQGSSQTFSVYSLLLQCFLQIHPSHFEGTPGGLVLWAGRTLDGGGGRVLEWVVLHGPSPGAFKGKLAGWAPVPKTDPGGRLLWAGAFHSRHPHPPRAA